MNFMKLSLAILLTTIFFSCTVNVSEPEQSRNGGYILAGGSKDIAWREGYIVGDGNDRAFYLDINNTNTFYHSTLNGNITLTEWYFTDTKYSAMSMQVDSYANDVDYIQLTVLDDDTNNTYSAEFTPNEALFGNSTVISEDANNVLTITYPAGVVRNDFLGSLKLTCTGEKNGTDYFDVYNSDNVESIF